MSEITVTIKPTLIYDPDFISSFAERVRAGQASREDLRAFGRRLKSSYDNMVKRIQKYMDLMERFIGQKDWRVEYLEFVGEAILKYAFKNASTGYSGSPALDAAGIAWDQRDPLTEKLYNLRYGNILPGLTTGADQLLDSLRIGDAKNIFEVRSQEGSVTVGTKWKYAKVLEKGGWKTGEHLGVNQYGNGPAEWLVRAVGEEEAWDIYQQIVERFMQSADPIPARPFLKPALWYVRQTGEVVNALIEIFVDNLQRTVDTSERWSMGLDELNITYQQAEGQS